MSPSRAFRWWEGLGLALVMFELFEMVTVLVRWVKEQFWTRRNFPGDPDFSTTESGEVIKWEPRMVSTWSREYGPDMWFRATCSEMYSEIKRECSRLEE